MAAMDTYNGLKAIVASAEDDMAKAAGGNKAAGTRVRKTMQEVKKLAQQIRGEVLTTREPK
jgi:Histone H1-like protein Hc1